MILEPAGRDEFLALMVETYGDAMSPDEFDWWFDRNPAGPRILNAAREDDGVTLGVLAMSAARMSQGLAAFAVHAVTAPAARGRGVFSTLELHNEETAAAQGARWALGFTNPMAGPILVGKLGWEDVTSLRIWVRPKPAPRGPSASRTRWPARCSSASSAGRTSPPCGSGFDRGGSAGEGGVGCASQPVSSRSQSAMRCRIAGITSCATWAI